MGKTNALLDSSSPNVSMCASSTLSTRNRDRVSWIVSSLTTPPSRTPRLPAPTSTLSASTSNHDLVTPCASLAKSQKPLHLFHTSSSSKHVLVARWRYLSNKLRLTAKK